MSAYEQFVEARVKSLEELLADIKAGRVFFCATCEMWVPVEDQRQDPLSDWPACDECQEDGIDPDNIGEAAMLDPGPAKTYEMKLRDVRDGLCGPCAARLDAALRATPDATKVEIKVCAECDAKMARLLAN
jgi:hypothetical protein